MRLVTSITLFALGLGVAPVVANAPDQSLRPAVRLSADDPAQSGAKLSLIAPAAHPAAPAAPGASEQGGEIVPVRLRPRHRPLLPSVVDRIPVVPARLRPQLRPISEQLINSAVRPEGLAFLGPDVSARPWPRPDSIVQEALFGRRKKRKGSVCGVLDIQGTKVGNIPGKLRGCGLSNGVSVRSVSGVALSRPATMDCNTAKALNQWVRDALKPAFRARGPVVEMRVAAHYICRTRNNQRGAKISEHGRGKAIDLSAFTMKDGEVITVLKGWGGKSTGPMLKSVHKAACGPFGTVLGPRANRFHRDHFHFDTASYRSGPYCK